MRSKMRRVFVRFRFFIVQISVLSSIKPPPLVPPFSPGERRKQGDCAVQKMTLSFIIVLLPPFSHFENGGRLGRGQTLALELTLVGCAHSANEAKSQRRIIGCAVAVWTGLPFE